MLGKKEKKALIDNLPEDWRSLAATEFKKSVSYVEKVCYGTITNLDVFEFLVTLAERHQAEAQQRMDALKSRLQNLTPKPEAI